MKSTPVDITPDKSLIKKLGMTGYRTEQAIAELVDNSIDARIPNQIETIRVKLDFSNHRIIVVDDGIGMNTEELKNAMTIAKGTKAEDKLGKFGLGMKSACSALGKRFTITTTKFHTRNQCFAEYDEEKWLTDDSQDWRNFEIIEKNQDDDWHGTQIEVSNLNVSLYPNQVSNFKERFAIRYAPYLKDGQIKLQINSIPIQPSEPSIKEGTKRDLVISLPTGQSMIGWIALLKKRSIKGDYGIHLFKNGRLIKAFDKFGLRAHPEISNVIGEINLDHLPVNFHKSDFIEESKEYSEAVKAFLSDSIVKETLRNAAKTREVSSDIKSVLEYMSGKTQAGYLDSRLRSDVAKKMLNEIDEYTLQSRNGPIKITFSDGKDPLYSITREGDHSRVVVNRNNEVFNHVKNPLVLIALIGIEAQLTAKDPELYNSFIQLRNTRWLEFIENWSKKGTSAEREGRDVEIPQYHNYGLNEDLIEIHEVLRYKYENKFQFTALSTLNRFLHHSLGKLVYTIQTTPGSGQYLADLLREIVEKDIMAKGEFVILYDLKGRELNAALNVSDRMKFLVVRETSEYLGFTVAYPEKAWIDFFMEIDTYDTPVSKSELRYTLEALVRNELIDKKRLLRLLEHSKRIGKAIPVMDGII